jgi:hypothetical protein
LAPGDSTVVELIFNTKAKGKVSKNARISSNDSTRASITIDFTANIVGDPDTLSSIRMTPAQLAFSKDTTKYSLVVQNMDSVQAKVVQVGTSPDGVSAKIKNGIIKAGTSGKVEIDWKGTQPEYDSNHVLSFDTGIKGVSRFSVPYTIRGLKGPKPGTVAQKPTANAVKSQAGQTTTTGQKPIFVDEKGNVVKLLSPDSGKAPTTQQWPPK